LRDELGSDGARTGAGSCLPRAPYQARAPVLPASISLSSRRPAARTGAWLPQPE
jgi:hypothetical protein